MEFAYKVKTPSGEVQSGKIEAANREAAIAELQKRGNILLRLSSPGEEPLLTREISWFERVSHKDIVVFARQFSVLMAAKVPLVQALKVVNAQTENVHFKKRLFDITSEVEDGLALSKALEKHPAIFSPFFVHMVRSAEYSGKLQETLSYLADHLDREYELQIKVRNALLYPAFVLIMLILVTIIMVTYVLPQISSVLKETGQDLPPITKLIIGIADFLAVWWWVLLFGALLVLGIFIQYSHTPRGRVRWDRTKLDLPLFGVLFKKLYLARVSRNLSTLITAGVPITHALRITGEVVGNVIYKAILDETEREVKAGNSMSSVFGVKSDIPPMVAHMVHVGEQTGKLDYTLGEVARFYEREVNNLVDNLVELILPVVVVVLGIIVGFFVVGIISPIYQFAQHL